MHSEQELAVRTQIRTSLDTRLREMTAQWAGADFGNLTAKFLACFEELPPYAGYKHIPAAARLIHSQMQTDHGILAAREFLYGCILQAMLNSISSPLFAKLPERIKSHQLKHYARIVNQPLAISEICEIDMDLFHKDFGLALLRLYAAAAQLVDYRAGIGRVMLMKNGLRGLPARLLTFVRLGGFKPFFEIHTHLAYLDEFNEEGWNECYRCCAELYALHPQVLGMYGGSWFYDPALGTISPRLNYLRVIPQEGGAYLLFDSVNEHSTEDATATSPTRKKLYSEGKYQPKSYALIWPRAAQIRWAKRSL